MSLTSDLPITIEQSIMIFILQTICFDMLLIVQTHNHLWFGLERFGDKALLGNQQEPPSRLKAASMS